MYRLESRSWTKRESETVGQKHATEEPQKSWKKFSQTKIQLSAAPHEGQKSELFPSSGSLLPTDPTIVWLNFFFLTGTRTASINLTINFLRTSVQLHKVTSPLPPNRQQQFTQQSVPVRGKSRRMGKEDVEEGRR